MRLIDADALEELFREVIGGIAKKPEMNGNLEHMVRASAMVIEMIKDAPTIDPDRIGKGTCDNCLYSSHFKNGLILCRRKKDSERVEPNHFCKHWKMDAKNAKMEA